MGHCFDRLCAMAENHCLPPKVAALVRQAKLFDFPQRSHEVLPTGRISEYYGEILGECFFLPFRTIAIEDTASVVLLSDYGEDVVGLGQPRFFIECMIAREGDYAEFADGDSFPEHPSSMLGGSVAIWGKIYDVRCVEIAGSGETLRYIIELFGMVANFKEGKNWRVLDLPACNDPQVVRATGKNVLAAIQEVAFFNVKDRFIVERVKTESKPKKLRPGCIARSNDRPIYILLTPNEFRTQIGMTDAVNGNCRKVTPHERRAHVRLLKSDRFVNKRGQVVRVRSTWIGASEGVSGKYRYRVLLDR